MKKIFVLLVIVVSCNNFVHAQETTKTFANKDNVLGVGFGIGGVYGFSHFTTQTPTFGLQYDRGIIELGMGGVIGVGGFVGYKNFVHSFDSYKERWNILIIGARGTFHYDLFRVENLDTYAGAMIAFHALSYTDNIPDYYPYYARKDHASAAYASLLAGARYYFAPKVSGFAEVGYGVSWLTMGVAFKF